MSVETTNKVAVLSGMSLGTEIKSQAVSTASASSDAFTATLKAQFQLLNGAEAVTPSFTSALAVQMLSDTDRQNAALLPTEQSVDLKSALKNPNILVTSQNTSPDLAEAIAESVAQPTVQGAVLPGLSRNSTEVFATSGPHSMSQSLVLQSLNTTLPPQNLLVDLAALSVPSVVKAPLQDAVLPGLSGNLMPKNPLPDLTGALATSDPQPTSQSPVLQSLNTTLPPQNLLPELATPLAANVAPLKLSNPAVSVMNSDSLTQSPNLQTMPTSSLPSEPLQELSTPQGKPKLVVKGLDQAFNLEAILQTLNGVIVTTPELNNATSVDLSLPQTLIDTVVQTPETAAASGFDLAAAGLVQVGVVQPVVSTPLKSTTPKIEVRAERGKTPTTLPDAMLPALSNAKTLPETVAMSVPSASSGFLAELNSSNPLLIADTSASKQAFATVLDNLSVNAASTALDTGIAKSLSGLAADLSAFDRPASLAGKVAVPPMTTHLYSPEWNKELGTKIVWMTNQNISSAELTLNPKHLGPISIHIDMQHDQASIAFTAHNAGVKEMLEASLPKLREMFQSQQLNLAEVHVAQQSFSEQGQANTSAFGQAGEGQKRSMPTLDNLADPNVPITDLGENSEPSQTMVSNGLVSLYA